MSLTYTDLQARIKRFVVQQDSDDFKTSLPDIIELAQERLAREIRFLTNLVSVVGNMNLANPVLLKPSNWRQTVSFNFGTGANFNTRNLLSPRSYEAIRTHWPDPTQTAVPKYYAEYNRYNWLIGPTPDQAYPIEVLYYANPQPLSDTNQQNWYTESTPDLLTYACLIDAAAFLKMPDLMQSYMTIYDRALSAYNAESKQRVVDRSLARTEGS